MIETWFKGYLAGIFTIMTLVLAYTLIYERIKRRKERRKLEVYAKVLGMSVRPGDTNDDLYRRVREWMRKPGHPDCDD